MNNTIWYHQDQNASCPGDIRQIMGTPNGYTIDGRYINMSTQSAHEEFRLSMTEPPSAGVYPIHTLHEIMTRMERNGEPPLTEEEIVAFYDLHWPQILEAIKGSYMSEDKDIITAENAIRTVEKVDREALIGYLRTFGLIGGQDGLTDNEIGQFIEVAAAYNLNPFKREVYCIPYGKGDKRRLSIITGYETYLKRAERLGLLSGWRCWTEGEYKIVAEEKTYQGRNGPYQKTVKIARGNLTATVEIHRKDWTTPFTHTVDLDEYNQENEMWGKMPKTMLKKVVTAQGFRLAFPDEMGGMPYTSDELPEDMTKLRDVTTEPDHDQRTGGQQPESKRQDHAAGRVQSAQRTEEENPSVILMAAKAKLIKLMTTQYKDRDLFEDDDKANVKEKITACQTMEKAEAASFLTDLATVYERKAAKIMADLEERAAYENTAPIERYEEPRENGLFDEPPAEDIF